MFLPTPNPERAKYYYANGYWRRDTIAQLFDQAAERYPDHVALSDARAEAISYRELRARVDGVAAFLAMSGLDDGDVVTICAPNWWQTVVSILAVLRIGGVVNPIPPTYGWKDVKYVVEKCRSKALFLAGKFKNTDIGEHTAAILDGREDDIVVIHIGEGEKQVGAKFDELVMEGACDKPLPENPESAAAILFTSGTESRPKGAVHTHNTILFGERCFIETLKLGHKDVCFMASPVSHATGFLHGVVLTLTSGGTLSLLDEFSATAAVDQMIRDDVTWTMGATPFLSETARELKSRGIELPSLRYFLSGGAPLPEAAVRNAMDTGMRVLSVYGSTESPPHTVVWPVDPPENAWRTDGRAAGAGIEVKIVDQHGARCAVGEVGEQWSRGPNTFLGYLGEPEITAKCLDADGWYHSGDLAFQYEDGSIRISGRIKDMIVRGGQNIAAREVEELLARLSGCRECALVGIPHDRLGETGAVVMVMEPGYRTDVSEVFDYLVKNGVSKFKIPERVECWEDLPKTPSGKVQKFKIQEILADN